MNNLKDVYVKLEEKYEIEWNDKAKKSFNLYFSNNRKEYKIYVEEKYVGIFEKKRLYKIEYWEDLGHDHNEDNTFTDLYECIIWYIEKYTK